MIRGFFITVAVICLPVVACADMIEVRGRGVVNGKIISQDEKQFVFRDSSGKVLTLDRNDVLFVDSDQRSQGESTDTAFASTDSKKLDFRALIGDLWSGASRQIKGLKRWSEKQAMKFREKAGKPLDRSGAKAKGEQAAKALDEAVKTQGAMAKKTKKQNAEIRRQGKEGKGDKDPFKSTFGSL